MSLHRVFLAAIALATTVAGLTVAPTPAAAQYDFTCHPARDHCPAEVRDNYTIFVDTDGSMNAESDRDICCGGGDDSYWVVVREEIEDFVDDNDNGGPCVSTAGNCESRGCDGVRVGIGFFGDDSDLDSGDSLAYIEEPAGEGKRSQVDNAVNGESAGNVGLPGIETLACPADGPGQSDTITCPVMGTMQETRIWCPPNGGVQIDEIGCPFDGQAQVHRIACPADAVQQRIDSTVTNFVGLWPYTITVDGIPKTVLSPSFGSIVTVAEQLRTAIAGDLILGARYTVSRTGATVRLVHNTPGSTGLVIPGPLITTSAGVPADPSGLPDDPAPPTTYSFDLDGNGVSYTSMAGDLSQDICQALADDINMDPTLSAIVTANAIGGILEMTADLPGDDFTVTSVSSDLNYLGSYGHLDGVPGKPAAPKTFDFDIDGTTYSWAHGGAGETALNICEKLIEDVNDDMTLEVTASLFNAGLDANGRPDYRIHLTSDVAGQNFTVANVDSDLRDFGTIQPNGAGLPGDPGDGYVYDFMLNTSLIQATGNTMSNTASVCTDLYNDVVASGEPVNVANNGTYITITSGTVGTLYTIPPASVDSELTLDVVTAGSAGLPGTPGSGHSYDWTWTDYDGTPTAISVPSPGAPTTATVCEAIRAELAGRPEFNASLNATMDQVTVTPAIQGMTWTFSGFDSYLSHSSTLTGALPNNPGIYNTYDITVDGTNVAWTDDGTPTQAEVCAGMAARINTVVGGTVTATEDGSTITITGDTAAAFDITSVESDLSPHVVVREAGLGPSAYADLAERIESDLNITTRNQNAIVITHRGPEDFNDFADAVDALCRKQIDPTAPATTYFIGVDVDSTEKNLLDILAAAGGSGSCSGGVDPCAVTASMLVNSSTMAPLVSCSGAYGVNEWNVDNALEDIKEPMSCTFELDVPPTYPDGSAPTNTDLTRVYINEWRGRCNDTIQVAYDRDYWPWDYFWDLDDCDGWSFANAYYRDGWQWVDSTDRKYVTFDPDVCEEIQEGNITEIETHVGCLCTNQGDECTAPFVDPMTGDPIPCKSPTHGRCNNPGGVDNATCTGGTATGDCSDDGYCMQTCTAEQLAVMRCATGVYLCDEDSGTETCTAGADNIVPEICNGIDDDCDGLVDNMSNNADDAFDGFDTQGRDCNGRDACICEDGWTDISSEDPSDLQAHLDTYSGGCECGEALGAPEPAMSMEVATDEPAAESTPVHGEASSACAVVDGEGRADLTLIGLLGLFLMRRRRRRRA